MSPEAEQDPFLTVAEVATLLKLTEQTVRNWIDAGSLPAVKIGRRVRIKRADFERIVDSGYMGGGPSAVTTDGPNAADFWGGEPVGSADLAGGTFAPPDLLRPDVPPPDTGEPHGSSE